MPRSGRAAHALLGISLLVTMAFLTGLGAPVAAQEAGDGGNQTGDTGTEGNQTGDGGGDGGSPARTYTVRALDEGCPDGDNPCWDLTALAVFPGEQVRIIVDLTPSAQPHNIAIAPPISQRTEVETGVVQEMTFQVPDDASQAIDFVCEVHELTMVGQLLPPEAWAEFTAGGGAHEDIPEMGVHFLAYWVGAIAFALLFIVYGITFFLFKYNETPATTDHWDRSGAEGASPRLGRFANLLAVVIAVAAIAAIVYVAMR